MRDAEPKRSWIERFLIKCLLLLIGVPLVFIGLVMLAALLDDASKGRVEVFSVDGGSILAFLCMLHFGGWFLCWKALRDVYIPGTKPASISPPIGAPMNAESLADVELGPGDYFELGFCPACGPSGVLVRNLKHDTEEIKGPGCLAIVGHTFLVLLTGGVWLIVVMFILFRDLVSVQTRDLVSVQRVYSKTCVKCGRFLAA